MQFVEFSRDQEDNVDFFADYPRLKTTYPTYHEESPTPSRFSYGHGPTNTQTFSFTPKTGNDHITVELSAEQAQGLKLKSPMNSRRQSQQHFELTNKPATIEVGTLTQVIVHKCDKVSDSDSPHNSSSNSEVDVG